MKTQTVIERRRCGFTIVEAIVACCLFSIVTGISYAFFNQCIKDSRGGASQARFLMKARYAEQKISKVIQEGEVISAYYNYLYIMSSNDGTYACIYYYDKDYNPETVSNNVIRYVPNAYNWSRYEDICDHVSHIGGDWLFSNTVHSPTSVRVTFHVGDGTNTTAREFDMTGLGYQGVEVRFSVAPRNLHYFFE